MYNRQAWLAWPLYILHETAVAKTYSVCGLLNVLWKAPFGFEHYFLDDQYETLNRQLINIKRQKGRF